MKFPGFRATPTECSKSIPSVKKGKCLQNRFQQSRHHPRVAFQVAIPSLHSASLPKNLASPAALRAHPRPLVLPHAPPGSGRTVADLPEAAQTTPEATTELSSRRHRRQIRPQCETVGRFPPPGAPRCHRRPPRALDMVAAALPAPLPWPSPPSPHRAPTSAGHQPPLSTPPDPRRAPLHDGAGLASSRRGTRRLPMCLGPTPKQRSHM